MEKKGVVMYGGAFNPPLNSHFSLAQQVLNEYSFLEKIIFVPVNSKYQKQDLIDNTHRYKMLKLVCENNFKFEVSDLEINSNRALYTIETLNKLQNQYPDKELYFLVGTDNLRTIDTWHNASILLQKYKLIVSQRDLDDTREIIHQSAFLTEYKNSILILNQGIRSNLSSTWIREAVSAGKDFRYLMPEEVYQYIKKKHLYVGEKQMEVLREIEFVVQWIKEYVEKVNAKGVVIGNSGGKDCATVIALATKALRKKPCFNSFFAL